MGAGHFGHKTLRHHKISAEVSVPKCPTLRHQVEAESPVELCFVELFSVFWVRSVPNFPRTGAGTGAEMSCGQSVR